MTGKDNKIFDVSKPGVSKPDTGSKPMVIGHKSLVSDPSIKTDSQNASKTVKPPSVTRIKLNPINNLSEDSGEVSESKPVEKEDKANINPEKTAEKDQPTQEEKSEEEPEEKTKTKTAKKEKDAGDIQLEREQQLQEMIQSKKYFVDIKEAKSIALRRFIITFLVVIIVGLLAVVVLIDAGVLNFGVKLPFNFIK